jgi:hypothetical protein
MAQTDSLTNSFEKTYQKSGTKLNYSYDNNKQIHNYSDNWDLDNDGINDDLFFVGTGGAHMYYFLRIILSTDRKIRDYSFLESDFPVLPDDQELTGKDYNPQTHQTQFVVHDFDKDGLKDIYIKLDRSSFLIHKKSLKIKSIKTNQVILTFKNGKELLRDFVSIQ